MAQGIQPKTSTLEPVDWQKYLTWAAYIVAGIVVLLWLRDAASGIRSVRLVNTTITGLLVGGIYSLVALGIVIINKASGIFNFAHGYMMYFGALAFYSFFTVADINVYAAAGLAGAASLFAITTDTWRDIRDVRKLGMAAAATVVLTILMTIGGPELRMMRSIVGAIVASVLVGFIIERLTIRPLISQPLLTIILMTLAVDRVLSGLTQLLWGSIDRPLTIFTGIDKIGIPSVIRIEASNFLFEGQVRIRGDLLVGFGLALLAFTVFVLFFRFTSVGLSMRATAENQQLAQSIGLRVRVILAIAWAIAALLAMIAGVLQGGATNIGRGMPGLALLAFPAVLLGGLESVAGALIGGLVIGLVQEWANLLFPGTEAGTQLAPYVILMVVLIIRPDGLFGQRRIERI